jgi:hypothetical protein
MQSKGAGNTKAGLRWPDGLDEPGKRRIDAAFRPMANDAAYRREALQLVNDFSASDAECWVQIGAGTKETSPPDTLRSAAGRGRVLRRG